MLWSCVQRSETDLVMTCMDCEMVAAKSDARPKLTWKRFG